MARPGALCSEADVRRLVISGQRLSDEPTAAQDLPVDVTTMLAVAARLLDATDERPDPDELPTLTLQLRGHMMLLLPEVEDRARVRAEDDAVRIRALAGVEEARRRLAPLPRHPSLTGKIARTGARAFGPGAV